MSTPTLHYGRPVVGFGGFYMRCETLVMIEERWTMNKRIVTCSDCLKIIESEREAARAYIAEGDW
jgi:hypothetical protein